MGFDPTKQLVAGSKILDPVMNAFGFVFCLNEAGEGSGGHFARGCYRKGNRVLDLHYRWGLGIVTYRIGDEELDHNTYMKLLGVAALSEFMQSKLDRTLDGFHKLVADLERFGADFLNGDGSQFRSLAEQFRKKPDMFSGFKGLAR